MIGLLAGTLTLTGCYKRVVRSEGGFGTSKVTTHEANLKNERIPVVDDVEDAIFGKRAPIKD